MAFQPPPAATRAGEIAYVCHYAHSFWVIPFLGGAYARTPYNPDLSLF